MHIKISVNSDKNTPLLFAQQYIVVTCNTELNSNLPQIILPKAINKSALILFSILTQAFIHIVISFF